MNIIDMPEKGKKGKRSNCRFPSPFAALPNFGKKLRLDLFYPKFFLNFLKLYFVKFYLFKADIRLYRILLLEFDKG